MAGAAVSILQRVPLFAELDEEELRDVARLFKERRFSQGDTVIREGSGGAAFFLVEEGSASVSVRGRDRGKLGPGDYFGEIALIDDGARAATIVAESDLVCHGLTYWDFRPLVQRDATICWKLLQSMAKKLRVAHDDL
jgi:CRP-like cAMP-binding protein